MHIFLKLPKFIEQSKKEELALAEQKRKEDIANKENEKKNLIISSVAGDSKASMAEWLDHCTLNHGASQPWLEPGYCGFEIIQESLLVFLQEIGYLIYLHL